MFVISVFILKCRNLRTKMTKKNIKNPLIYIYTYMSVAGRTADLMSVAGRTAEAFLCLTSLKRTSSPRSASREKARLLQRISRYG